MVSYDSGSISQKLVRFHFPDLTASSPCYYGVYYILSFVSWSGPSPLVNVFHTDSK